MFAAVAGVGGRWSRRRLLTGARRQGVTITGGLLTPGVYGQWIRDYRAGRFVETARKVSERDAAELRYAQRGALDSLPPLHDPDGFLSRLAAAALHAEAVAHFGWNQSSDVRLLHAPTQSLPERWILGLPPSLPEDVRGTWGGRVGADPRRALFREVALAAARPRLAILGLGGATRVLEGGVAADYDPVLRWQLAAVLAFRARYVREDGLWRHVLEILTEPDRQTIVFPRNDRSAVARAIADPDDRRLRLALASLGTNRRRNAEQFLAEVREDPWGPLQVPRWMIEGETLMDRSQFGPASEVLGSAAAAAPASQPAAAAYVAALQASGRWEEAAALARDRLTGSAPGGISPEEHPWLSFLLTWARPGASELEWLRRAVAA